MKNKTISKSILIILLCVVFVLSLVGCEQTDIPDIPDVGDLQLEISGYSTAIEVGQDGVLSDEDILSGITAKLGETTYVPYIADKSAVNMAAIGEYSVVIGIKDGNGNIVNGLDGKPATVNRTVKVVEVFYADIQIQGLDQELSFEFGAEITDAQLLEGLSVSEGFTLYVKDRSGLDSSEAGEYSVVIGVKKGERIVKSDATHEVTEERYIIIEEEIPELHVTFYFGESTTPTSVYVELNSQLTQDELEASILAGVVAKDDDFNEYELALDMSAVNVNEAGNYNVTVTAMQDGEPLCDSQGQPFATTRTVIVKVFETLQTPQQLAIGAGNNIGMITFSKPAHATDYVALVMNKGEAASEQDAVAVIESKGFVPMGFVDLASGDYTVYIKALADGYKQSAYSEGFDITFTLVKNFSVEELGSFADRDHGTASVSGGHAKIVEYADGWGKVVSESFNVNMDKSPILALNLYSVEGKYFACMIINNSEKTMRGDTQSADPAMMPFKTSDYTGTQSVQLELGCASSGTTVDHPVVMLDGARIFYLSEYTAPIVGHQLTAPTDFAPKGAKISWSCDSLAEKYDVQIVVMGSENVVASTSGIETREFQVAQLPAGDYTLRVQAIGDGTQTLSSQVATYDFSVKEYANWSAQDIGNFTGEGWETTSTVKYDGETGYAIINHDGSRGYGAVGVPSASAPIIDLSKRPVIVMEDVSIAGGWLARAFFGSSGIIGMQNDTIIDVHYDYLIKETWTNVDGNYIGSIGNKENPQGTGAYRFLMGFVGGNEARVQLKGMRIVYVKEYSTEMTPVQTPSGFGTSTDGGSIQWNTNALKYKYELYALGGEVALAMGEGNGSTFAAVTLPAGNYTLKVQGLGDGVETSDSQWGEYSFTVTEIVAYSAQDIVNSELFFAHDGKTPIVTLEGDKARITNDSDWAVWAPIEAVQLNFANRPVIVMDGLTLINDCWLARSYIGATTIVMQNDTAGTSAWQNATWIRRTWVNVDGNSIGANTGNQTNPAGLADYQFGIGINGSGIVELSSIRIVFLTEYTIPKQATPSNFNNDGENITWQGSANKYEYSITRFGEQEVLASGELESASLSIASMEAGNYTLTVIAKGDGVNFVDSLPATYNFAITGFTLTAPQNLAFGTGAITFDAVANATSYTGIIVALGGEATATPVATFECATNKVEFIGIDLASGSYTLYVKACATGADDSAYSTGLDFTFTLYASYGVQEIGAFTNKEHAEASIDGQYAKVTSTVDGWGRTMGPQVTINFDANPVIAINFHEVSKAYFLNFVVDGNYKSLIGDTYNANPLLMAVKSGDLTGMTGVQTVNLIMGVTGGNNPEPYVLIEAIKIYSVGEYVAPPAEKAPVDTASEFAVASNGYNISWTTNSSAYDYELYIYGTEDVVNSGNAIGKSFNVASLSAGSYTLKVKCLGDGVMTADAEAWGLFNFKIEDKYNYDAAALAQFIKIDGDAVTAELSQDGTKAVFTATGWGIAAPQDPNTLDSASSKFTGSAHAVLVVKGINVKSGAWCFRAYVRGSGNSYAVINTVMHNDDGNSNDLFVHETWKNVDGNFVTGFTGNANEPGGYIRDYMVAFGATNNGTIEVESIRVIVVSAIK